MKVLSAFLVILGFFMLWYDVAIIWIYRETSGLNSLEIFILGCVSIISGILFHGFTTVIVDSKKVTSDGKDSKA